ncbi:putative ATP-binding cassette transporter [Roseovarius halotolerans]|uniref:Inner membrane ABC transporter ATP-binding protein YddA n=1 Tax=Roseovarius halotolerans TaxID=505353 RepID=A0A1X6YAD9_9RHOB|nr:SbmA/BacA-like family transporter [Roseovarius halotolerans]RKT35026.1 putative ATP-binding cassette transporter [Roseovarius halotolerans]SLN14946.1 Inner membrane ABC transporter ATP-binding protein YddA [Roseovarius halotolerans]
MRVILGRIWRLTLLAASGPRAWVGLTLFGTVLGLQFADIWVDLQMIDWSKRFFDALEQRDAATAIRELWVFGGIVGLSAAIFLISDYLRKRLLLRWRARLTDQALDRWTGSRAYWHLRPGMSPKAVDNPDQRVAEDCRHYVRLLLEETLDLVTRIVALVSYVAVLWNLSDFVLTLPIFGSSVDIPRYLVWLAFIYVAVSSLFTHLMGRPLKSLVFHQERFEADFRHSLIQLRDNATEIAYSGGEPAERRRLAARFDGIRGNWNRLIRRELILGLFTRPYFQSILRVPLFFALPAYFMGAITLGGLMQLSGAFGRVTQTLSWFIFSYRNLAEFAAVAERLDDLFANAVSPAPMPGAPRAILRERSPDAALHVEGLRLSTPQGKALAPVPDKSVLPGARVWIAGASGRGKSTLLAAISGLWPYGEGRICLPEGRFLYLPQKPHLFTEGLAAAACYPADPEEFSPGQLREAITRLGLGHRLDRLDMRGPGALEGLSMGERQRLALARALLLRPDWVVLDEATSALDAEAEAEVLGVIRAALPDAAILCVAHRPPKPLAPYEIWRIGDDNAEERKSA